MFTASQSKGDRVSECSVPKLGKAVRAKKTNKLLCYEGVEFH